MNYRNNSPALALLCRINENKCECASQTTGTLSTIAEASTYEEQEAKDAHRHLQTRACVVGFPSALRPNAAAEISNVLSSVSTENCQEWLSELTNTTNN